MMAEAKKVFVVGPGFIGWNIIDNLAAERTSYHITALVRRDEHAKALKKSSTSTSIVDAVIGDLHDHDVIVKHTLESEIVFHTATADDLESVLAILDGIKRRAEEGKSTIYIHTSGTSVLDDHADGAFKSDTIYYDNRPEDIDKLPDDAPHRPIDLEIVRAQKQLGEKAKMAIMTPPEIYGYNPKHQRLSIQVPLIARFALKHGYAGHVGKGLSVESQVHVFDLARAYIILLHHMETAPAKEILKNPYWFCENGKEFSWLEMAQEIGKALHAAGKINSLEPKTIPTELYGDLFGDVTPAVFGLNSRSRAVRLRELGWEPKEKSIWESFNEDELPAILASS